MDTDPSIGDGAQVTLRAAADHLAFEHIESGKQRGRAVPLVVVRQGTGATLLYRQAGLGAFRYMRGRWAALIRCFDDGRLALDNNPAERALCGVAIGRDVTPRNSSR